MSDEELEYLTTTRQRRANAGSRLRQLIDLENDTQPQVSRFVTEDDENVDLLFAEDADDEEFQESDDEDLQDEMEDVKEPQGEGDPENEGEEEEDEEKEENHDLEIEPVNSDDVLSDSDISLSDTDEDEGERELEKQERLKKRKQKLSNRIIPKIKKFKSSETKSKSKPKKKISVESIMQSARKSSRTSAIEKKEALVQKLREDEERRASMAPIIRIKQRELTQEEKLAEAVETEKANILSLEAFQQQEIVKKERQKYLLQLKRKKLVNVIRWISKQEFVTPNEEIETARNLYYSLTTRSRKRSLKKIQKLFDVDLSRVPGDVDKRLPYYVAEMEKLEMEKKEKQESENAAIEVEDPLKLEYSENGHPDNELANDISPDKSGEEKKTVTFAIDVKEGDALSETETPEEPETPQEIFAGPVQRIARNVLQLYDFTAENPLTETNIKKFVLGEDSLLTGSRRFKDLKTILKLGIAGNPYAKVKEEKDELFTPATDLKEDNPIFEELNRLPQLGIRQEIIEETVKDNDNDSNIHIKTEAPLGLYLPNGNKKACLITGTEVKYFDPGLGVPYSDVDTLKLLKLIEQGSIPWYSFDGDYNHTGPASLYLGSRDGTFRHAKGVPEGFD